MLDEENDEKKKQEKKTPLFKRNQCINNKVYKINVSESIYTIRRERLAKALQSNIHTYYVQHEHTHNAC